jgi:hypothetical protein
MSSAFPEDARNNPGLGSSTHDEHPKSCKQGTISQKPSMIVFSTTTNEDMKISEALEQQWDDRHLIDYPLNWMIHGDLPEAGADYFEVITNI